VIPRRWLVLTIAAVLALAACSSSPPRHPSIVTATRHPSIVTAKGRWTSRSADPGATFLAVTNYPAQGVALRRFSDGNVETQLSVAHGTGTFGAAESPDGSIILTTSSTSGGCHTRIERLDPKTGATRVIRTVSDTMSYVTLSPDGHRLAYVTYPSCAAATPYVCPGGPRAECSGGPAASLPNVLGVLDLTTGATVRSGTDNVGHPILEPTWSPDGKQLAVTYPGEQDGVLITSATRPELRSAPKLRAPAHCTYGAPAWTVSGIVVSRACPLKDPLAQTRYGAHPDALALVSSAGRVSQLWPLPRCVDGITSVTDPQRRAVLVQSTIGYGNDACGAHWSTEVSRLDGTRLTTLTSIGDSFGGGAGWLIAGT
jgi:dipeptidyl aminopeptidase/acylaminoacyl peptidase